MLLLIFSFKFKCAFPFYLFSPFATSRSAIPSVAEMWLLVSSCDHELWLMTLILELDLNRVTINQHAGHVKDHISNVIFRTPKNTYIGPNALPRPQKCFGRILSSLSFFQMQCVLYSGVGSRTRTS